MFDAADFLQTGIDELPLLAILGRIDLPAVFALNMIWAMSTLLVDTISLLGGERNGEREPLMTRVLKSMIFGGGPVTVDVELQSREPKPMDASEEKEWVLSSGRSGGLPIYMRVRVTIPDSIARRDFPENLVVTWKYQEQNEGLPSEDDLKRMELMEDRLMATLSAENNQSHLVVVTTSNGIRQWLWKTRSAEQAVGLFGPALAGLPPFPIEIEADEDPDWAIYEAYLARSGANSG